MSSLSVPKKYNNCPSKIIDSNIKFFDGTEQADVVVQSDVIPVKEFDALKTEIAMRPLYACKWSLERLYGEADYIDYYKGSQTWFTAVKGGEKIFSFVS